MCPALSGVFSYFSACVFFDSSPVFLVEFLFMKQIKVENMNICLDILPGCVEYQDNSDTLWLNERNTRSVKLASSYCCPLHTSNCSKCST